MAKSLKINYVFNLIDSILRFVFPLISFPYASRIVLADGIGKIGFLNSIIAYITLFTCIGIPVYGIREVARLRGEPAKLNKATIEILLLHLFMAVLAYLLIALICIFVPKVAKDAPLFLLLSLSLLLSVLGCNWFYAGKEDFVYIAIRNLIINIIGIVLLFTLVKTKEDLMYYAFYYIFSGLGSNLLNFIKLGRELNFSSIKLSSLQPFRHFKPSLHIFVFNIACGIYQQSNNFILGFFKKDVAVVGFYYTALKIFNIIIALVKSLGGVMMPKMSKLIVDEGYEGAEFKRLSQKSYDYTTAIAFPIVTGLIFISPYCISIISGPDFSASVSVLRLLAPAVLFSAISYIFAMQTLYPMSKVRIINVAAVSAAIVDLILCFILIPLYSYHGAAIAYLLSELVFLLIIMIAARRYLPYVYWGKAQWNHLLGSLVMMCVLLAFVLSGVNLNDYLMLLIESSLGFLVYVFVLYLRKDMVLKEIYSSFYKNLRQHIHKENA